MIKEPTLIQVSPNDKLAYLKEAKEVVGPLSRFIVKQRHHVGAVYLALRFLAEDLEKQHPEVKGLYE